MLKINEDYNVFWYLQELLDFFFYFEDIYCEWRFEQTRELSQHRRQNC